MLACKELSYQIQKRNLISGISLTFAPGHIYGIIGPNGSGKSTLLKNLAGIWRPTLGMVLWQDKKLSEKNRQEISKIITYVPQQQPVIFNFTVAQFVAMGRYAHCRGNKCTEDYEVVGWALAAVDAYHLRQRVITELSAGERQRVYIARALATEAEIVLLDEPTATLDIRHQMEIWNLLELLLERNRTIIVANHDLMMTERKCHQVAVLHDGKCITYGSFEEVVTSQLLYTVFGIAQIGPIQVRGFSLPDSTLDLLPKENLDKIVMFS